MSKNIKNPKRAPADKSMTLTNQEIFETREPLSKLMNPEAQRFPVRVSYNLAKMASMLQTHLKVIVEVRDGIIKHYGKPDEKNPQQISVPTIVEKLDNKGKVVKEDGKPVMIVNPDFGKFVDEMAELMAKKETIDFGNLEIPVKLPEMVAATCDKCHHNMDRPLEIEPGILLALEKFVEV